MEFRILGPLEVFDGERALNVGGAKQRSQLAVLLLNANQVVSSDRLLDALWGEEPSETARKAIQIYVSQLRTVLGKERLETKAPGYLLRVDRNELDLHRLETLLEQTKGDRSRGRFGETARGARALAGPASRGVRLRGVRAGRDRAPRGTAPRVSRGAGRCRSRLRPSFRAGRRAGGARGRAPAQGAFARAVDAGAIPVGAAG